ncbi:MAG: AtpZ/AtpI family protein [Rhodospirillales bacterium]|nr:AtpZ/AtpI family protein [Rhodospirillales bacterium]
MTDDPAPPSPSFEARLRAARDRQGLDPAGATDAAANDATAGLSPWGIGARVGVEMVSALVVALAIGWGLDWWLGTRPIFLAIFVLLGGAAGVLNVWRLFAPRDGGPGGMG